jgi:hypothetical protein
MLIRRELALPVQLHVPCQGCGELVPTAQIRSHLAEHASGRLPYRSTVEAFVRGSEALRRTRNETE